MGNRNVLSIVIIVVVTLNSLAQSITIPLPFSTFPLNGNLKSIPSNMGAGRDSIIPIPDRFGIEDAASNMVRGQIQCKEEFREVSEFSISFWLYNNKNVEADIYNGYDNDNRRLIGITKKCNGDLFLNMHHHVNKSVLSMDSQRLWDNCRIVEEGWYYVVVAYSKKGTNVYITSPAGELSSCWTSFIFSPSKLSYIVLGDNRPDTVRIDDLKMYDLAISNQQVKELYGAEKSTPLGGNIVYNAGSGKSLLDEEWYFYCVNFDEENPVYVLKSQKGNLLSDGYGVAVDSVISEEALWIVKRKREGTAIFNLVNLKFSTMLGMEDEVCAKSNFTRDLNAYWSFKRVNSFAKAGQRYYDNVFCMESVKWNRIGKSFDIHIDNFNKENIEITICDANGLTVGEWSFNQEYIFKSIPIEIGGIYFVTIYCSEESKTFKIFANV